MVVNRHQPTLLIGVGQTEMGLKSSDGLRHRKGEDGAGRLHASGRRGFGGRLRSAVLRTAVPQPEPRRLHQQEQAQPSLFAKAMHAAMYGEPVSEAMAKTEKATTETQEPVAEAEEPTPKRPRRSTAKYAKQS
jgi:hypothetical protein